MDRLPRSTPQAPLQPPTSKSTSLPLPLPLPLSSSSSASQESSGYQHALLKHFFGFGSFRPLQQAIINAAIRKYDTFVCMATASGKSLCYQLPALITGKCTVVVSPLISLMEDQVLKMNELRGVKACYISSSQAGNQQIINRALNGDFHIIYITPEKIVTFIHELKALDKKKGICLFAVDETHCVSEWGHEFRPEYRQLSCMRENFPDIPIMALTATATPGVQVDIQKSLNLQNAKSFISSFNRPNLFYSCKMKTTMDEDLKIVVQRCKQTDNADDADSCIIYCPTISDTEDVARFLQQRRVAAQFYHSRMAASARANVHRGFQRGDIKVVVATVAFGMGIDKPDVRLIVHYGPPRSIESYYQQSGRAGRDGDPSECILYYSLKDFASAEFTTIKGASGTDEAQMEAYRRIGILRNYCIDTIELDQDNCCGCDNCCSPERVFQELGDYSTDARLLMQAINETGNRFGLAIPIQVLLGSQAKRISDLNLCTLPVHGKGWTHKDKWWKELAFLLKRAGYLKEITRNFYTIVELDAKGRAALHNKEPVLLPVTPTLQAKGIAAATSSQVGHTTKIPGYIPVSQRPVGAHVFRELDPLTSELFGALITFRKNEAFKNGVPAYSLFNERTLRKIAEDKPANHEQLRAVEGMDDKKMQNFGDELIFLVAQFLPEDCSGPTTTTTTTTTMTSTFTSNNNLAKHSNLETPLRTNSDANLLNHQTTPNTPSTSFNTHNSPVKIPTIPTTTSNNPNSAINTPTLRTPLRSTPSLQSSNTTLTPNSHTTPSSRLIFRTPNSAANTPNTSKSDNSDVVSNFDGFEYDEFFDYDLVDNLEKANNNSSSQTTYQPTLPAKPLPAPKSNIFSPSSKTDSSNVPSNISSKNSSKNSEQKQETSNNRSTFLNQISSQLSNSASAARGGAKIDLTEFPDDFFELVYQVIEHYQNRKAGEEDRPESKRRKVDFSEEVEKEENGEAEENSVETNDDDAGEPKDDVTEPDDAAMHDDVDMSDDGDDAGEDDEARTGSSETTDSKNEEERGSEEWIYASKDQIIVDLSEDYENVQFKPKKESQPEEEVPDMEKGKRKLVRGDTEVMSEQELREAAQLMEVKNEVEEEGEQQRDAILTECSKNTIDKPVRSKSQGWKRKHEERETDDLLDFIEQTIEQNPRENNDQEAHAPPTTSPSKTTVISSSTSVSSTTTPSKSTTPTKPITPTNPTTPTTPTRSTTPAKPSTPTRITSPPPPSTINPPFIQRKQAKETTSPKPNQIHPPISTNANMNTNSAPFPSRPPPPTESTSPASTSTTKSEQKTEPTKTNIPNKNKNSTPLEKDMNDEIDMSADELMTYFHKARQAAVLDSK